MKKATNMSQTDFMTTIQNFQKQRVLNEIQRINRLDQARELVEEKLIESTQVVMERLDVAEDAPQAMQAMQVCLAAQGELNKAVIVTDKTLKTTFECMGFNPNEPVEVEALTNEFESMEEGQRGKIIDAATTILSKATQVVEGHEVDENGEVVG
jgi:hypothetical protein